MSGLGAVLFVLLLLSVAWGAANDRREKVAGRRAHQHDEHDEHRRLMRDLGRHTTTNDDTPRWRP